MNKNVIFGFVSILLSVNSALQAMQLVQTLTNATGSAQPAQSREQKAATPKQARPLPVPKVKAAASPQLQQAPTPKQARPLPEPARKDPVAQSPVVNGSAASSASKSVKGGNQAKPAAQSLAGSGAAASSALASALANLTSSSAFARAMSNSDFAIPNLVSKYAVPPITISDETKRLVQSVFSMSNDDAEKCFNETLSKHEDEWLPFVVELLTDAKIRKDEKLCILIKVLDKDADDAVSPIGQIEKIYTLYTLFAITENVLKEPKTLSDVNEHKLKGLRAATEKRIPSDVRCQIDNMKLFSRSIDDTRENAEKAADSDLAECKKIFDSYYDEGSDYIIQFLYFFFRSPEPEMLNEKCDYIAERLGDKSYKEELNGSKLAFFCCLFRYERIFTPSMVDVLKKVYFDPLIDANQSRSEGAAHSASSSQSGSLVAQRRDELKSHGRFNPQGSTNEQPRTDRGTMQATAAQNGANGESHVKKMGEKLKSHPRFNPNNDASKNASTKAADAAKPKLNDGSALPVDKSDKQGESLVAQMREQLNKAKSIHSGTSTAQQNDSVQNGTSTAQKSSTASPFKKPISLPPIPQKAPGVDNTTQKEQEQSDKTLANRESSQTKTKVKQEQLMNPITLEALAGYFQLSDLLPAPGVETETANEEFNYMKRARKQLEVLYKVAALQIRNFKDFWLFLGLLKEIDSLKEKMDYAEEAIGKSFEALWKQLGFDINEIPHIEDVYTQNDEQLWVIDEGAIKQQLTDISISEDTAHFYFDYLRYKDRKLDKIDRLNPLFEEKITMLAQICDEKSIEMAQEAEERRLEEQRELEAEQQRMLKEQELALQEEQRSAALLEEQTRLESQKSEAAKQAEASAHSKTEEETSQSSKQTDDTEAIEQNKSAEDQSQQDLVNNEEQIEHQAEQTMSSPRQTDAPQPQLTDLNTQTQQLLQIPVREQADSVQLQNGNEHQPQQMPVSQPQALTSLATGMTNAPTGQSATHATVPNSGQQAVAQARVIASSNNNSSSVSQMTQQGMQHNNAQLSGLGRLKAFVLRGLIGVIGLAGAGSVIKAAVSKPTKTAEFVSEKDAFTRKNPLIAQIVTILSKAQLPVIDTVLYRSGLDELDGILNELFEDLSSEDNGIEQSKAASKLKTLYKERNYQSLSQLIHEIVEQLPELKEDKTFIEEWSNEVRQPYGEYIADICHKFEALFERAQSAKVNEYDLKALKENFQNISTNYTLINDALK